MTNRLWTILGAAVVALLVIWLLFNLWQKTRTQALENRVAKGQAEASVNSGAEAMNTVSNVAAAQAETERIVKEATNEIRSAPAGNSNAAAERAACKLRQYKHLERCARLRAADTKVPAR